MHTVGEGYSRQIVLYIQRYGGLNKCDIVI